MVRAAMVNARRMRKTVKARDKTGQFAKEFRPVECEASYPDCLILRGRGCRNQHRCRTNEELMQLAELKATEGRRVPGYNVTWLRFEP